MCGGDFCGKNMDMENMGMPVWAIVLVAVLGTGGFSSLVGMGKDMLVRYVDSRKRARRKAVDGFHKLLPTLSMVYDEMNRISACNGVLNVSLMKLENGGGVPVLGSDLSCTLLYEVYLHEDGRFRDDWQKTGVMSDMMQCLARMYESGEELFVASGAKGGFMNWCANSGVNNVQFYKLRTDDTRVLFLMLCYGSGQTVLRGDSDLEMSVSRLRNLCKAGV